MNRTKLVTATLAAMFIATPLQLLAKASTPRPSRLETRALEKDRLLPLAGRNPETADQSELARAPFRFRLMAGTMGPKTQSLAHEWRNGSLMMNTMRAKSLRLADRELRLNFNRFSVWGADLGLVHDLNGKQSVSLGVSYALERRRPSFSVAPHNAYYTTHKAITLGWTRDGTFRLNASLFSSQLNRQRSERERIVELAGGAQPASSGMALIASVSPTRDLDHLAYGIDLRSQSFAQRDAVLAGFTPSRRDARVGLFVKRAF
jgi:hypothetical protein